MNKINIISPIDKLYNDAYSILVVCPSNNLLASLQKWLIDNTLSINVYLYTEKMFAEETFLWLLDVFKLVDLVIIDVDFVREQSAVHQILSYMIAKPKTYWLTKNHNTVYNYISNNRVYDLNFLSNLGVTDDKKQ